MVVDNGAPPVTAVSGRQVRRQLREMVVLLNRPNARARRPPGWPGLRRPAAGARQLHPLHGLHIVARGLLPLHIAGRPVCALWSHSVSVAGPTAARVLFCPSHSLRGCLVGGHLILIRYLGWNGSLWMR